MCFKFFWLINLFIFFKWTIQLILFHFIYFIFYRLNINRTLDFISIFNIISFLQAWFRQISFEILLRILNFLPRLMQPKSILINNQGLGIKNSLLYIVASLLRSLVGIFHERWGWWEVVYYLNIVFYLALHCYFRLTPRIPFFSKSCWSLFLKICIEILFFCFLIELFVKGIFITFYFWIDLLILWLISNFKNNLLLNLLADHVGLARLDLLAWLALILLLFLRSIW